MGQSALLVSKCFVDNYSIVGIVLLHIQNAEKYSLYDDDMKDERISEGFSSNYHTRTTGWQDNNINK